MCVRTTKFVIFKCKNCGHENEYCVFDHKCNVDVELKCEKCGKSVSGKLKKLSNSIDQTEYI